MSLPPFKTYQDALDHLVDYVGGSAQDQQLRKLKRAIELAVEHLLGERYWNYFLRHGRVQLYAPYETGTVAYDHTGGSSERLVALTSGTWPSWAAQARLAINSIVYDVEQRIDDTTITLTESLNPGEDVASGTSYELYQNFYQLPHNFRMMWEPESEDGYGNNSPVTPWMHMARERHFSYSGLPSYTTIMADPDRPGGFVMGIDSRLDEDQTLDFIYLASPGRMKLSGYESKSTTGTAAVSASSTAVVGTGTSFSSDMVGAIMRFTSGSTDPTGYAGANPYDEQIRIRSVESTTALTLETAAVSAYSGKNFTISDLLDFDRSLWEALLRCCEYEWLATAGVEERRIEGSFARYKGALTRALEQDDKIRDRFSGRDWKMLDNYTVSTS